MTKVAIPVRPYLFTSLFYLTMAALMAVNAALVGLSVIPAHAGLSWLRIHLITIGTMSQALFGLLPALTASRAGRSRPATRWDIWLTLNAGLVTLLIGIPIGNAILIIAGGSLVFTATVLLISQLRGLRSADLRADPAVAPGGGVSTRWFYVTGLAYLLVGIVVGTGLWLGWAKTLRIAVPIEVHIHANNWGFMALVFAGLLFDLMPRLTGSAFLTPRATGAIYWMMTVGALGLVIGPWVPSEYALVFSVPALLLHLSSTLWLLAATVRAARSDASLRGPGVWHLVTSYFWFLAPVLIAPLIIFKVPGFPGAGIEANAPQALVYGWVLQFGYALLPYLLRRVFFPAQSARLGGNWFSLAAVHLGGFFLWAGIFFVDYRELLRGTAYSFWLVSLIPIAVASWRIAQAGIAHLERADETAFPSRAG